jgi:RimJ/RimL family protein N-acetyltransferase
MTIHPKSRLLTESFSDLSVTTGRLTLMPEGPGHGGMLEDGKRVSEPFSAQVPDSWPPAAVEPPTQDAIGWKRFYLSHTGSDRQESVIGIAGIGPWSVSSRTVQVGAALVPEYFGQRLGEEVVSALGKWALSQPSFDSVVCDIPEHHEASAKSLSRAGYRKSDEAPAPGFVRFVMTR